MKSNFTWPLYLNYVSRGGAVEGQEFGYLMNLLPDGYYEMKYFLFSSGNPRRKVFKSYFARLLACMRLVYHIQWLHQNGLAYLDMSAGNFAFNPENGKIVVMDCDNITCDGLGLTVRGTPGYMAPEIPNSGYRICPSVDTDRYSLAVVLYRILFVDHPMDGRLFSTEDVHNMPANRAEDEVYNKRHIFCFDPHNDTNRPNDEFGAAARIMWNVYPQVLKDAFIKAFTEGIQPGGRVSEGTWLKVLSRTNDRLVNELRHGEQFALFEKSGGVPIGTLKMQVYFGGSRNVANTIAVYHNKVIYVASVSMNVDDSNILKKFAQVELARDSAGHSHYKLHNRSEWAWEIDGKCVQPNGSVWIGIGSRIRIMNRIPETVLLITQS